MFLRNCVPLGRVYGVRVAASRLSDLFGCCGCSERPLSARRQCWPVWKRSLVLEPEKYLSTLLAGTVLLLAVHTDSYKRKTSVFWWEVIWLFFNLELGRTHFQSHMWLGIPAWVTALQPRSTATTLNLGPWEMGGGSIAGVLVAEWEDPFASERKWHLLRVREGCFLKHPSLLRDSPVFAAGGRGRKFHLHQWRRPFPHWVMLPTSPSWPLSRIPRRRNFFLSLPPSVLLWLW